jgi:hypothetical protein
MRQDPRDHGGLLERDDDLQRAASFAMLDVADATLSNDRHWPGSARIWKALISAKAAGDGYPHSTHTRRSETEPSPDIDDYFAAAR